MQRKDFHKGTEQSHGTGNRPLAVGIPVVVPNNRAATLYQWIVEACVTTDAYRVVSAIDVEYVNFLIEKSREHRKHIPRASFDDVDLIRRRLREMDMDEQTYLSVEQLEQTMKQRGLLNG